MEETQAAIATADQSVLKKVKGYWSKKEILVNTSNNIVLLNEKATTADAISAIQGHIGADVLEWVTQGMLSGANKFDKWQYKGSPYLELATGFDISDIPSLQKPEWMWISDENRQNFSWKQMMRDTKEKGMGNEEVAGLLARSWYDFYAPSYWKGLAQKVFVGNELLLTNWDSLKNMPILDFLMRLCDLMNIDIKPSRFDESFVLPHGIKSRKKGLSKAETGSLLRTNMPQSEIELFQQFSGRDLKEVWDCHLYEWLLTLSRSAAAALAILREKGFCLWPKDYAVNALISSFFDRTLLKEIYGIVLEGRRKINDVAVTENERGINPTQLRNYLRRIYLTSTLSSFDDMPINIRDVFNFDFLGNVFNVGGLWKQLSGYLDAHAKRNNWDVYPVDTLSLLRARKEQIDITYTPEWCAANLPQEWTDFLQMFRDLNDAGDAVKLNIFRNYAGWAWGVRKFQSPWDVRAEDIINPFFDGEITFFKYVKTFDRTEHGMSRIWSYSRLLYERACNAAKMTGSPFFGRKVSNPFLLDNPFSSSFTDKTTRSRMRPTLVDVMTDILLEPDENGVPYKFARDKFKTDIAVIPDPEDPERMARVWNFSRPAALAMQLLTPLRRVQIRWLDEGLMDDYIYDITTGRMVENTHSLRNFRYENGKSHKQQYGHPSGVLQFDDDMFNNKDDLGLFINTNKTKIWDPKAKKNGYFISWPTGEELMDDPDPAIRDAGKWLNRVYQVIFNQLKFIKRYDPNPMPLSFYHSREDKRRVDSKEESLSRMPFFVPLFRDLGWSIIYDFKGNRVKSYGPLTDTKLQSLFTALAIEAEKRFAQKGITINITKPAKNHSGSGYRHRICIYDPHSLRVAGISQLLELGVPMSIVQIIAGHSFVTMTNYYNKPLNAQVREELILAAQRRQFAPDTDLNSLVEKVTSGRLSKEKAFVYNEPAGNTQSELSEDYSSFALRPGGFCRVGGLGSQCHVGQRYYRVAETGLHAGKVIEEYGDVQSGCGNCRFFATSFIFLIEQQYYFNLLECTLKKYARHKKEVYKKLVGVDIEISECAETKLKYNLEVERIDLKQAIADMEETMKPMFTELVNRLLLWKESLKLLEQQQEGEGLPVITGLLGQGLNYKPEIVETTEFGMYRRVMEDARFLERKVICPDDVGDELARYVDILLDSEGSPHRLFLIRDKGIRIKLASQVANFIADVVGDDEIQRVLDDGGRLQICDSDRGKLLIIDELFAKVESEAVPMVDSKMRLE